MTCGPLQRAEDRSLLDAHDLEFDRIAEALDLETIPERDLHALGGQRIDHEFAGRPGQPPCHELQLIEPFGVGQIEPPTLDGGAANASVLVSPPVGMDEGQRSTEPATGGLDPGPASHVLDEARIEVGAELMRDDRIGGADRPIDSPLDRLLPGGDERHHHDHEGRGQKDGRDEQRGPKPAAEQAQPHERPRGPHPSHRHRTLPRGFRLEARGPGCTSRRRWARA